LFTKAKQATVRPQPVLLKKFPEYCTQMLDTPTRLGSEYQLLATLSADISEANSFANGQLPENRRKNRYINILPCKYAENLGWTQSINMKCFIFMIVILMVGDTLERVGDYWLLTVLCYAFL
jgi:hypothetical protein